MIKIYHYKPVNILVIPYLKQKATVYKASALKIKSRMLLLLSI